MKTRAKKPPMSKESLLPLLMAHVLANGLGQASLRPLAQAAGTSDRMLLYHFGTKENLISELLAHIAAVYAQALDMAFSSIERPTTRAELLSHIIALSSDPAMHPFQMLWWEIVSGSGRELPGFRSAAQAMMAQLLVWLEARMPEGDPDPAGGARYLMTLNEGALMLRVVGHDETARTGLEAGLLAGGPLPS